MARQLSYIGKMVRHSKPTHIPRSFLIVWVDNKQKRGRSLFTNKNSIVHSLSLILPAIPDEPETESGEDIKWWKKRVKMRKCGDEKYWEWIIDSKLRKPHLNIPPQPVLIRESPGPTCPLQETTTGKEDPNPNPHQHKSPHQHPLPPHQARAGITIQKA